MIPNIKTQLMLSMFLIALTCSMKTLAEDLNFPKGNPIELGKLIKAFMLDQKNPHPTWSMNVDNKTIPLIWITDGVEEGSTVGQSIFSKREAAVRVMINGKVNKVLRKINQEILWQLVIRSHGLKKFPPEYIDINPDENCFNPQANGCNYDLLTTLGMAGIKATSICETADYKFSQGTRVYLISAKSKFPAYLVDVLSTGSQGTFRYITLTWDKENSTVTESCGKNTNSNALDVNEGEKWRFVDYMTDVDGNKTGNLYIKSNSVKRHHNDVVEVWLLNDVTGRICLTKDFCYRSSIINRLFKCQSHETSQISEIYLAGRMGKGDVVDVNANGGDFSYIASNSTEDHLLKEVCK